MPMAMRIGLAVFRDDELRRRHAGPDDSTYADVAAVERQAAEGLPQIVERQAGIEQGAEDHVAGDAREAIEVKHAAHGLEIPCFLEAEIARVAEVHVIEQLDPHERACCL